MRAVARSGLLVWLLVAACNAQPSAGDVQQAMVEPTAVATPLVAAASNEPAGHQCEGSPVDCGKNAAPPMPQAATGGQLYGAALDETIQTTALTELLAQLAKFANQTVRTTGTIGRVCQNRGCWMELRTENDGKVARVPMAGHAFFVPSDVSGRTATIQGAVSVRQDADNPLRIDATSVLIANNNR